MAQATRQRTSRPKSGPAMAVALMAGLAACAGDFAPQETAPLAQAKAGQPQAAAGRPETPADDCGRLDAAADMSTVFFDAMGDMGDACADGDVLACNPANYAIGGLAGVVFMPMGFLIGLASPEYEARHCAEVRRRQAAARPPETPEEERARLWARAVDGDAEAQFEAGERLFGDETDESRRDAWYWFCRAAHQRHAQAQYRLGGYSEAGWPPARRDLLQAYLWYELAADQHVDAAADAQTAVAAHLSATEVARAERRAAAWRPTPEDCRFDRFGNTARATDETGGTGGHAP